MQPPGQARTPVGDIHLPSVTLYVHPTVCQCPPSLRCCCPLTSRAGMGIEPGQVLGSPCPSLCLSLRASGCKEFLLPAAPLTAGVAASVFCLHLLGAASKSVEIGTVGIPLRDKTVGQVRECSLRKCFGWAALGFAGHSPSSRALPYPSTPTAPSFVALCMHPDSPCTSLSPPSE